MSLKVSFETPGRNSDRGIFQIKDKIKEIEVLIYFFLQVIQTKCVFHLLHGTIDEIDKSAASGSNNGI